MGRRSGSSAAASGLIEPGRQAPGGDKFAPDMIGTAGVKNVIYHAQRLMQIHALLDQGQPNEARAQIEQAVLHEPDNPAAWHLAGVIRRRTGDLTGAITALRQAIAAGQPGAEVWNSLGLALEDSGQPQEALPAFEQAIEREPEYVAALTNRARMLCQAGEHQSAERSLRDALQRQPHSVGLLNSLGATLLDAGRADDAEPVYRKALALQPDNRVATIRLGQALREMGQAAAAVQLFRESQPRLGGTPEFVEAMAGALTESGEWRVAEAELEQLCNQAPGYFPAHRALVRLGREYGSEKDCYRSFRAMAQQWPRETLIWHHWLSILLQYRDYADLLTITETAAASIGDTEQVLFSRAIALGELGRAEEAEAVFQRLEQSPTDGTQAYLSARARNAIRLHDGARAERFAAQAAAQDPLDQFALAYLGLAWRLLGDEREFWLHDYERQAQQIALAGYDTPGRIEELCDVLRELHHARHHPPDQSLRGGTQTEGALFLRSHPAIRQLRDAISETVLAYVSGMPDDDTHPFYRRKQAGVRFTGSWSVRLTEAGFHIVHIHQAGWISSALHLVVPPVKDGEPDNAGALVLGEPPAELALGLPPRRIVRPKEGHLVLFPSSMWHGTVPFEGGNERLTVAFDVVPV